MKLTFYNPPISDDFFCNVKEIVLNFCGLIEIPRWVNNCKNLLVLDISQNCIESVGYLGGLLNLADMRIDDNYLTSLDGIGVLRRLTLLSVGGNKINNITALHGNRRLQLLYIDDDYLDDGVLHHYKTTHVGVKIYT